MATSINMRGKAATGGGAGGGGKSRLRQEWDNLLDHPNPATQQQFEEDYAMADPSSNLFNPRKVLSNRNNLKNYANKKGMPDSRVNAMATKIAKAQMDEFHRHVAQSAIKSSLSAARSARQSYSVPSNRAMIPFIGGGGSGGRALTGEYIPAGGSSSKELKTISRTLHEIKKIDSKELSIFTRSTAVGPFYGRTQAHVTGNRYAYAGLLGGPGGGAIGFPAPSYAMSRYTQRISAGGGGFGGVGGGGFGPGAAGSGGGGITAGEAVEGGGVFSLLKRYIAPIAAVTAVATAPWWLTKLSNKVVRGASPYMPLSQQMGRFGRAYGGNKLSFMNQIMPRGGKALPTWMLTSGIMPDQVAGIMGSYGAPIGSLSKFKQIMGAVGYANNMNGFGGMSKNIYAGILGQGAAMGILPSAARKGVSVSLGGMTSSISGPVSSDHRYMTLWGRVMQTAVKSGLNRAEVLQSMKHSLSQAVGTSGLGVSARSVLGFGARLMTSGAPSMRTGAGILSMEGNLQRGSMSVGKLPVQTMAFMEYERKMNHGHLPTSIGGIKRILGSREYAALSKTKAGRMALANIAKLGKNGFSYFAAKHLAHLASNDYNLTERVASSFAGSGLTGVGLGPSIAAAESGTTWRQRIAYVAGGGLLPLAQQKAMHAKAAASYGNLLLFESKHRSALRRMEIGSMTNDVAGKLKRYGGNVQSMLRAYHYGKLIPGKGYGTASTEMQYAQGMGWRGSSTFVKSRKSAYKQAMLAKGIPPKDVNRILADAERKNVNPLILASIPGAVEDQSWSLIARNPKSTAFGLGQQTSATMRSDYGSHANGMRLYNRGVALSGAASPYVTSPNTNASIRGANLTAQVQHLRSSYIIFETLATNMSSLAGVAKLADKAIGNLAQSAMDAAKQLAHGHIIKGTNDFMAGSGPKHAMQLHVIKNP